METSDLGGGFSNISQRAAFSYLRAFSAFNSVLPEGLDPQQQCAMEESQRQLHRFFQDWLEKLVQSPQLFGLPEAPDDFVVEDGSVNTQKKQELNRKLKKSREGIQKGLEFLRMAGQEGVLDGQNLVLEPDPYHAWLKKAKTVRKFLNGLEESGLAVQDTGDQIIISSAIYPAMMPALKTLAQSCAEAVYGSLGLFHFGRCDFNAIRPGYIPDALDLYRVFDASDYERVARLHDFFTGLNFKLVYQIQDVSQWVVKYQGNRKVKASPLYQVGYDERQKLPMQVQIKCASANRIVPLMARQSDELQADFFQRAYPCRGADCGWCRNQKKLGPSVLEYHGTKKVVCWYSNSDVRKLDEESERLIRQYALMHEELA
jgi:hypothetical protein